MQNKSEDLEYILIEFTFFINKNENSINIKYYKDKKEYKIKKTFSNIFSTIMYESLSKLGIENNKNILLYGIFNQNELLAIINENKVKNESIYIVGNTSFFEIFEMLDYIKINNSIKDNNVKNKINKI